MNKASVDALIETPANDEASYGSMDLHEAASSRRQLDVVVRSGDDEHRDTAAHNGDIPLRDTDRRYHSRPKWP